MCLRPKCLYGYIFPSLLCLSNLFNDRAFVTNLPTTSGERPLYNLVWQCLPQWATPAQLTCWSGDIKGALSTYFLIANHPKVPPKHFVTIYNHRLGGLSRVVVNDRLKRTVVQLRWGRTSGVYIKVRSPLTREYVCTRYKGCGEPLG